VAGTKENLPQLPDGEFLPGWELNDAEKLFKASVEQNFPGRKVIIGRNANLSQAQPHHEELGRTSCQNRSICERGCSFGANHSSLSSSLPAAERTGNLTTVTDAIVHSLVQDPKTGRITSVRVIDAKTMEGRTYEAKVFFLNASTFGTAQILLNSKSEANPRGLCNKSDQVGRNYMRHTTGSVYGIFDKPVKMWRGTTMAGIVQDEARHDPSRGFVGGYELETLALGLPFMAAFLNPGAWGRGFTTALDHYENMAGMWIVGEDMPQSTNRVTLSDATDQYGLKVANVHFDDHPNDVAMRNHAYKQGMAIYDAVGATRSFPTPPYPSTHNLGTNRMSERPEDGVCNKWGQTHDIANLFISDGSQFTTGAAENPTLTIVALAIRQADHIAREMAAGTI
jgi:choline dehydrogenase-like flavoprotein